MKSVNRQSKIGRIGSTILSILAVCGSFQSFASANVAGVNRTPGADTPVSAYIRQYLSTSNNTLFLNYPKSVGRFYETYGKEAAWVNQANTRQTWQSMMLLDCVLQYGLSYNDYHPKDLLYDPLHTMIEEPKKISNIRKAKFDILLTDALITLMNNMHYGKLNPEYGAEKIDDGFNLSFHAETALLIARQQTDFMKAIESAQPRSKQYAAMQDKLRQMEGVYKEDCYDIPAAEITKIAINMERLRWADLDLNTYMQVNIPSYILKLVQPDTVYLFKVVVGKPSSPTPSLNSNISYIATFPKYKVTSKSAERLNTPGAIVFKFLNNYAISLHDTRDHQSFTKDERALGSNGIRVENATTLARLLLKNNSAADEMKLFDKAMRSRLTRNISINKPMPLRITYLTCEVDQGQVIIYKDVYDLDKRLAMALYSATESLTAK